MSNRITWRLCLSLDADNGDAYSLLSDFMGVRDACTPPAVITIAITHLGNVLDDQTTNRPQG